MKKVLFDKVYIFHNAKCFAHAKVLSSVTSLIDIIYPSFSVGTTEIPPIFEVERTSTFDCVISRQSFINYTFSSKPRIWIGELREYLKKVNLRDDVLPSALSIWMTLYAAFRRIQTNFIRFRESIVIHFSHFCRYFGNI